jgi:hypothetical protein
MGPVPETTQPPALSAATSSAQVVQPFSASLWISCGGSGGELVALVGQVEITTRTVEDENGGMHVSGHARPVGVTGVSAASGRTYRGTGGTVQSEHYWAAGDLRTWTLVNNFRIIGQGPSNNVLVHLTIHQTYNADGELTADVDVSSHECK